MSKKPEAEEPLYFKVLGRTVEHFGTQLYKRRPAAVAELVANCWDAGATGIDIQVPLEDEYDQVTSKIVISDNGVGMSRDEIQDRYLVLGLNRRQKDGVTVNGRRLMGRKGIGKLAGFGLASKVEVVTWRNDVGCRFVLDRRKLKLSDNEVRKIPIPWEYVDPPKQKGPSGTIVTLSELKHKTPVSVEGLGLALGRRFTRTVRNQMEITVNGTGLPNVIPELIRRVPEDGLSEEQITKGLSVRYWYGFAEDTIKSRELRGFAVMLSGKVAQAPPFFFDVEATASGQHSTRYVIGEIEADFLDDNVDEESDVISTDRQEIDWEHESASSLRDWGQKFARRVLIECAEFRGSQLENWVLADQEFGERLERLDTATKRQVGGFLRKLGKVVEKSERARDLVSALLRAYEYRHFADVIDELEQASEEPETLALLLGKLHDWHVLESRAILEVVKGRLAIIDKFEKMLVEDTAEKAPRVGADNMHDLLAGNSWLLRPDWQILKEEISVTKQLREWAVADSEPDRRRIDFLALGSDKSLVVIEIKRPGHAASIDELNRLVGYREKLTLAHDRDIYMVLLCGRDPKISAQERKNWDRADDREIRFWSELFALTKSTYNRYRALLEADIRHPDFKDATEEVIDTRKILESGSVYREKGKKGKGSSVQDAIKSDSEQESG